MREKCILHIGMHKTGTSSIQYALFNHLNSSAFNYCKLGGLNHNHVFSSIFKNDPKSYHANTSLNWSNDDLVEFIDSSKSILIKNFESLGHHVIEIISGEDIGYFNQEEAKRLKIYLSHYFNDIVVVVYLRSPVSYLQSAFQELVKHGLHEFDFTYCDPKYIRFKHFSEIFGFENIIFRNYDEILKEKNSVIDDFTELFGIELNKYTTNKFSNLTLSLEAVSLLYVYQSYYVRPHNAQYFKGQNKLIDSLKNVGDRKLYFSQSIIEPIVNSNQVGIEFIKSKCDIDYINSSDINKSESYITCEDDLVSTAISSIGILAELLVSEKKCSIEEFEISKHGVAKLMHTLDLQVNGPIAASLRISK
jgi:hypothetical protein